MIVAIASVNSGGNPITGYTVACASNPLPTQTGSGGSSPITVTGMTNDTAYDCAVIATNAVGNSAPSNLLSLTPRAAAPLALTEAAPAEPDATLRALRRTWRRRGVRPGHGATQT